MSTGVNHFGVLDYLAVILTLGTSLAIGIYPAIRGKQTSEDLLMGGRSMKVIPIGVSLMVTYFSAATIIGNPAEIYSNGISIIFMVMLLTPICLPISLYLFMSVLYKLKLTSVYEYFELRFESPVVRCATAAIFIIKMVFYNAISLYAPSLALGAFLGLPTWVSVVGIGVIGTIYTSVGGLKAVVWTDVLQFILILVGMFTMVIRGFMTSGGIGAAFLKANQHGRLNMFNWSINVFDKYNTPNQLIGTGIFLTLVFGTNQPNVQRYASVPTFRHAMKAMVWNAFFKTLMNSIVICTGIAIFATYAGCDPILLGKIEKADQIVPYFFVNELLFIPGIMGVLTSCIFSAVLSTVSSVLNSLAAVTWQDFVLQLKYFQKRSDVNNGKITIIIAAIYGVIGISLAFIVPHLGSIFQISWILLGATDGTLGACFFMGMFMPFVDSIGALIGLSSGFLVTGLLTIQSLSYKYSHSKLPNSIDECPADTNFTLALNATLHPAHHIEIEWPEKLWTITYILYPAIGFIVTIFVGGAVSLLLRACNKTKSSNPDPKYLHPIAQKIFGIAPNNIEMVDMNENSRRQDQQQLKEATAEEVVPMIGQNGFKGNGV